MQNTHPPRTFSSLIYFCQQQCPLLLFTSLLVSSLTYLGLCYFNVPRCSHSSAWALLSQGTAISRVQFPKQHDCHWVGSCKQVLSSTRWTWWQLTTGPLCIKGFHNSVELCYHSLSAISCNCSLVTTARSVQETVSLVPCMHFIPTQLLHPRVLRVTFPHLNTEKCGYIFDLKYKQPMIKKVYYYQTTILGI